MLFYNIYFVYTHLVNWRTATKFVPTINHEQWRMLLFASVLFFAQILFQLHGLEHLQEPDHDEHSAEYCVLCILGAALDGDAQPDLNVVSYSDSSFGQIEYSYSFVYNFKFDAFSVRAPPLLSSFA